MDKQEINFDDMKLNILYFGPLGLQGGIGGSARVKNMLAVLKKLGSKIELISYLPEQKFRISGADYS